MLIVHYCLHSNVVLLFPVLVNALLGSENGTGLWIGFNLHKKRVEWVDGSSVTYDNWAPGQPVEPVRKPLL